MNLNLQQLSGIINDDSKLIDYLMNYSGTIKLSDVFSFNDIVGTSVSIINEPEIQKHYSGIISRLIIMRPQYLPPGFKLAEGTIPVEPVEGGWKWNGNLTIRDFNWSNPIFKGKPVVEVTGNFSIQYSGVTSLRGCPSKIGGSFLATKCKFKTLEFFPTSIGDDVDLSEGELESLDGLNIKELDGDFDISKNNIKSLKGCPQIIDGYFDCQWNNITSLEYGPKTVGGDYICADNNIKSLKGVPEEINGDFNCSSNNFSTLEGGPKSVEGDYNGSGNYIGSDGMQGKPEHVGGSFYL